MIKIIITCNSSLLGNYSFFLNLLEFLFNEPSTFLFLYTLSMVLTHPVAVYISLHGAETKNSCVSFCLSPW